MSDSIALVLLNGARYSQIFAIVKCVAPQLTPLLRAAFASVFSLEQRHHALSRAAAVFGVFAPRPSPLRSPAEFCGCLVAIWFPVSKTSPTLGLIRCVAEYGSVKRERMEAAANQDLSPEVARHQPVRENAFSGSTPAASTNLRARCQAKVAHRSLWRRWAGSASYALRLASQSFAFD